MGACQILYNIIILYILDNIYIAKKTNKKTVVGEDVIVQLQHCRDDDDVWWRKRVFFFGGEK